MPDLRYGIESPCRPAGRHPGSVSGVQLAPISRTTSNVFDSPEPARECFEGLQEINCPASLTAPRTPVIRPSPTMRRPLRQHESRPCSLLQDRARLSLGIGMRRDIVGESERASPKATG